MKDPGDRKFHVVMGVLLAGSLIVDQQEFEAWRAGHVSMVSLAFAMVWLGCFTWEGLRRRNAAIMMLKNRIDEIDERVDELMREAQQRRGPF